MSGIREKISNMKETAEANAEESVVKQTISRDRQIVKASVTGILANVFLAAFKAVIGVISGSIAITLDAVNNLSDAAGSVITIVGTKLAAKPADKKHPFGYGRIEYLSAMIISLIVLYAGITSLRESIDKIIHPQTADYTAVMLIIVGVAVAVKIILGRYTVNVGRKVNSDSLVNSGKDATLDSVISASTLAAAIIYILSGVSLEAWLGAIISAVIIKAGIEMLIETLSEILGERADIELAKAIKETVMEFEPVSGVYDMVLNNYGPDNYNGSLHIEVPDTCSANEIDNLTRKITYKVFMDHQVILTAISVYSVNTKDPEVIRIREDIKKIVFEDPFILQMHGFYVEGKKIRLDLVISFDSPDRAETYRNAVEKIRNAYPDYQIEVVMDTDFAEND